jgi:hypothetical protein
MMFCLALVGGLPSEKLWVLSAGGKELQHAIENVSLTFFRTRLIFSGNIGTTTGYAAI